MKQLTFEDFINRTKKVYSKVDISVRGRTCKICYHKVPPNDRYLRIDIYTICENCLRAALKKVEGENYEIHRGNQ